MSLFLVATPIGNLEDMTLRAQKTLGAVDIIFAEDTRHTGQLLKHFGIATPMLSYHEHSGEHRQEQAVAMLQEGRQVALVSDAGLPCLNDPGQRLVKGAIAAGVEVIPLPGANAALTALIASGLSTDSFTYLGFYPRKKDAKLLALLGGLSTTVIFYESPNRIQATIAQLAGEFPERKAVIARELTKLHEEFLRGTLSELQERLAQKPIKGEIVLLLEGAEPKGRQYTQDELMELLQEQLEGGLSKKEAALAVSQVTGEKKNKLYALCKDFS